MYTDWINLVLSICYIVPEGVEYIRKQGGVYEIYYPPKTAGIESNYYCFSVAGWCICCIPVHYRTPQGRDISTQGDINLPVFPAFLPMRSFVTCKPPCVLIIHG